MSKNTNYCFTLNNYSDAQILSLKSLYPKDVRYLVFSREVGAQGTPHLQGYVQLHTRGRLAAAIKLLPGCHVSVARGTPAQNLTYISKEAVPEVLGTPSVQGKRADLHALMEAVRNGCNSQKQLREEYPEICSKYPRFVKDYVADCEPEPHLENHPLRDWQGTLYKVLSSKPDDRTITFIVDPTGNSGKTWFAKYWHKHHEESQIMEMAKKADMAYALDPTIRVLFVNCTRQQVDFLNYSFLEAVKDGLVFSPKYESRTVKLNPCHVVVMMNKHPDLTALSEDRYNIVELI